MICPYCSQNERQNLSLLEILGFKTQQKFQLCSLCRQQFVLLPTQKKCQGCARPSSENWCQDCLRWQKQYPEQIFTHHSLFTYNDAMKKWFDLYKFKGNYLLRFSFVSEMTQFFRTQKQAVVIPIPLCAKRLQSRGFNQVEGLLTAANVSFSAVLRKTENLTPQSSKTREERLLSKQPFSLIEDAEKQIAQKKVILVDDIYTTGRTLMHAIQVVRTCRPQEIQTFSLSR